VILEGIVTTLDETGALNVAPMGPEVGPGLRRFVLRPYKTATTYRNLKANGAGVLHVTDDVLLLARAAIGPVDDVATRAASAVRGRILMDCCRYYEFQVLEIDDSADRTTIAAATVAEGRRRDFFGLNRAKHAVVEAAILATRVDLLPLAEVLGDLRRLAPLVTKTGGPAEAEAFALLTDHVRAAARARGLDPDLA
jgi:hypothetical protein